MRILCTIWILCPFAKIYVSPYAFSLSNCILVYNSTGNQLWQHDFPTDITAAQFSNSGDMIAVACEDKNIHVFSKGKNESSLFVEIANSCSRKKISCVAFSNDESELWFGDKFGDVHSIPTTTTTTDNVVVIKNPELRLGHVSLLTDMVRVFVLMCVCNDCMFQVCSLTSIIILLSFEQQQQPNFHLIENVI